MLQAISVSRFEPVSRPGRFRTRSNSHPVAARSGYTNIPRAAGGAQEDETILQFGCSSHTGFRFVRLDPAGLIRSWGSGDCAMPFSSGLHHGAFDDDAGAYIFPQGDE